MFKYQQSIRQKIIFGYYIVIVVIVGLSVSAYFTLRFMEKKIIFSGVISELFDTTLEIRRFEKNFFLYNQDSDFEENIRYVKKAQDILERNMEDFKILEVYKLFDILNKDLKKYRELMEQFMVLNKKDSQEKNLIEIAIREKGKEIINMSGDISQIERLKLQLLLNKTRRNLFIGIIFLSLGSIALGQVLSRMVVKPLESLEDKMRLIAEGKLETVSINSRDREIVSLTNAFNKMLRELEVKRKHLIQREKLASLGTLLSGVAHELNNPLSNISSSCQILIEEFDEGDTEHKRVLLSQIDGQTERAKNIVRALLEYSRDTTFKKENLPLKNLIEETILFVRGEIQTGIEVILDIPNDISIFAGKQRIQQVFLNLIKNAIESIKDKGKVIIKARKRIASGKIEEEKELCEYDRYRRECTGQCPLSGNTIDIEIEDTGVGIPPDVLPKIFDPFFSTKAAGKGSEVGLDVGTGSGLGLYIVQEIIQEHYGCIGVYSEVGKGTAFLLRLPTKE